MPGSESSLSSWRQRVARKASLGLQLPLQNLANQIRIRLAFAQFHHLALKEIQGNNSAFPEVGHRSRVRRDDLIAELLDGGCVAHLRQSFLLNNGRRRFARVEHLVEDLLRDGSAD